MGGTTENPLSGIIYKVCDDLIGNRYFYEGGFHFASFSTTNREALVTIVFRI